MDFSDNAGPGLSLSPGNPESSSPLAGRQQRHQDEDSLLKQVESNSTPGGPIFHWFPVINFCCLLMKKSAACCKESTHTCRHCGEGSDYMLALFEGYQP